jgi:hypothetical protein
MDKKGTLLSCDGRMGSNCSALMGGREYSKAIMGRWDHSPTMIGRSDSHTVLVEDGKGFSQLLWEGWGGVSTATV